MFEEELRELGLTENEVRIYLLLLRSGPLSPSSIAAKAGLHRPSAYDSLDRMQEKGVVSALNVEGKRAFQAVKPEALVEILRYKTESLQSIVPGLNKLFASQAGAVDVQVHRGRRCFRTLLKDVTSVAKKGDMVLAFGVDDKLLTEEIEPIYLKQYFTIINERGIHERVIIRKGGYQVKSSNSDYREIDPALIGNAYYMVYGDRVAFFIQSIPYHIIIIDSPDLADTMRKQFSFFWEKAGKTK